MSACTSVVLKIISSRTAGLLSVTANCGVHLSESVRQLVVVSDISPADLCLVFIDLLPVADCHHRVWPGQESNSHLVTVCSVHWKEIRIIQSPSKIKWMLCRLPVCDGRHVLPIWRWSVTDVLSPPTPTVLFSLLVSKLGNYFSELAVLCLEVLVCSLFRTIFISG